MLTVKITSPVPIMLNGMMVLPDEKHTVNLSQYLLAKEKYPNGLVVIVSDEPLPPIEAIEPAKEAEPPHDESVQVSPTTRKRRTTN